MEQNRIKEYREAKGLNQVELSRIARIASPNLSAIERGRLRPWMKIKKRLSKALKCSVVDLFPTNELDAAITELKMKNEDLTEIGDISERYNAWLERENARLKASNAELKMKNEDLTNELDAAIGELSKGYFVI